MEAEGVSPRTLRYPPPSQNVVLAECPLRSSGAFEPPCFHTRMKLKATSDLVSREMSPPGASPDALAIPTDVTNATVNSAFSLIILSPIPLGLPWYFCVKLLIDSIGLASQVLRLRAKWLS